MKYERLTNCGEPFYGFEKCRTCEYGKDGCDKWCDQITGCFCRLQELEDKIASGELCDRKETAREIAEMLKAAKCVVKVHFEAYDELIDNILEKYGKTEQVENFDKLEDEE